MQHLLRKQTGQHHNVRIVKIYKKKSLRLSQKFLKCGNLSYFKLIIRIHEL